MFHKTILAAVKSLVLSSLVCLPVVIGCASSSAPENSDTSTNTPPSSTTSPKNTEAPSQTMKEGAAKVGEGVGDVARGAAQGLKEGVCPVVGIRTSKVFYTKSDKGYEAILKGEKTFSKNDNRECFVSAENAHKAGYARVGEKPAR